MFKTLVVYSTKMGMSGQSAEIITKILRDKYEQNVDLVNLEEERIKQKDLENYENIIIGSGINMNRWYSKSLKILNLDFTDKRVFVFICTMSTIKALEENDSIVYKQKIKQYLDDVVTKNPTIKLISKGVFGGKKKNKGDLKRENWKQELVEQWANSIGNILTSKQN
ncbi:MAG: hypothetical protein FK730_10340 [Asgard group archaeon]|nr:hypothetical protein [Asgard group archaeon]